MIQSGLPSSKPGLNTGIYTPAEAARLLGVKLRTVTYVLKRYYDSPKVDSSRNTTKEDKVRTFSFSTLIELNVFAQLRLLGVQPKNVFGQINDLVHRYNDPFPFTRQSILESLTLFGDKLCILGEDEVPYDLNSGQVFLEFVKVYLKKLDFENDMVTKFYPLGDDKGVVCNPKITFGSPTITGTRIHPLVIAGSIKAGDSEEMIATIYNLTAIQVQSALNFYDFEHRRIAA